MFATVTLFLRSSPLRNSNQTNGLRTPIFCSSATPTFLTTSALFNKHRRVYSKNRNSSEGHRPIEAQRRCHRTRRFQNDTPALATTCSHHNHSAPVAPQSLSMYSLALQRARRLGPQFGSAIGSTLVRGRSEITSGFSALQLQKH
jgi:hypothetical protein